MELVIFNTFQLCIKERFVAFFYAVNPYVVILNVFVLVRHEGIMELVIFNMFQLCIKERFVAFFTL
jgi:hypothetical protein